jgi:hypothetical protein
MAARAPAAVIRSEGQRMLLAVVGTLEMIAQEIGCKSPQMVQAWRTGAKIPAPAARARMETAFGIPARAWSVRPGGSLDPEPPPAEAPTSTPSTLEDCLALLTVIRRDRMQTGLLPSERVRLAGAEAQILNLRARLEQAAEFAEQRYVTQHPSWLKLKRAIVKALEPHPIAAKAVADVISKMEA